MMRDVCLGEQVLKIKQESGISPSAEKILSAYFEKAKAILGTGEDGAPDWEQAYFPDKSNALHVLDLHPEYGPLLVETEFLYDKKTALSEGRNPFLVRDEHGEIYATDEGVKVCTERIFAKLETSKKDLENPPESVNPKTFPQYLLFVILSSGGVIYSPRIVSALNAGQKQVVKETIRKVYKIFEPYLGQVPSEDREPYDNYLRQYINLLTTTQPEPAEGKAKTLLDYEELKMASSPFISGALPPMFDHSKWQATPAQIVYSKGPDLKDKDITYIIARAGANSEQYIIKGREAWEIVEILGVDTALLHAFFATLCMDPTFHSDTPPAIGASILIKLLDLNERKKQTPDGKRVRLSPGEQLRELEGYLNSLRHIHVHFEGIDRDGNLWKTDKPEPLWDINIYKKYQATLGDPFEEPEDTIDLSIHIRPGRWIMHEKGVKDCLLYSHISKNILDFNRHTEEWGLKWAIYTSCYTGKKGYHTFKIRTLLEAIMPKEALNRMNDPKNQRERHNITNNIENQLQSMENHGWKIKRSPEYSIAIKKGPGGRRQNNYFNNLLDSSVTFTPPSSSLDALRGETLKQIKPSKGEMTGTSFRDQRKRCNLSQSEVGRILGKSQTFISQVERGEKSLSKKDLKKWEETLRAYRNV